MFQTELQDPTTSDESLNLEVTRHSRELPWGTGRIHFLNVIDPVGRTRASGRVLALEIDRETGPTTFGWRLLHLHT